MKKNKTTYYPPKEEKLNVLSHALGLLLSIIAFVLLVTHASEKKSAWYLTSFSIYGASLIVLYAASTLYHYVQAPKLRQKLNVLDHAAIYVLIAGTYTPFALIILHGWVGWLIFGILWGIAILGILYKVFFFGKYKTLSTFTYVFMGWIVVFTIKPLIENLQFNGLMWLFAGGLSYTIGAILYSLKKIKYNHAIFHLFVLIGSFCHFMAIYFYVLPYKI